MNQARHSSTPASRRPAARWLLAALFGSAILVTVATVWAMHVAQPDRGGTPTWSPPSSSASAGVTDGGQLQALLAKVAGYDDDIQRRQELVNADPQSDTPRLLLDDAVDSCIVTAEQYSKIARADPAAVKAGHLPAQLAASKATDCIADNPTAAASLPTVFVSGIPATY